MTNLKVNEQALNPAGNQAGSFEIVNDCSKSSRRGPTREVRRKVESAFETLLDRIAAEDRNLNVWESKCLSAALIMMADDDYDSAAAAIEACERYPRDCLGPGRDLMIQDMRALYAMLKGWPSLPE